MTPPNDANQTLEQQVTKLQQLVEISLSLNSTLALEPLLQMIMDVSCELVDSEATSILLIDRNTRDLVFSANNSGGSDDLIGRPVPLQNSIAGTILLENRPFAFNDVSADPRHYEEIGKDVGVEVRSLLGVPMRIKDEVIGVLEAINKRDGPWTRADASSLLVLASQAAVAIHNAQLMAALRKAYDELDKTDKLKNDFIAIASHELRTPLGIILGYASFLRMDTEGESLEHADVVFQSALQLRSIIEQLTNLVYLKEDAVELSLAEVSVADLLRTAQQDIQSLAEAKGHLLVVRLPDADRHVTVDVGKMATALGNLLNNAVKFTPAGGEIVMETQFRPDEVWIIVRDNGVGIPPESADTIFDEFYQVEDHLTRRHGGMGLGLSIAQGLVAAHQGRLWAESAGADQGSSFFISLPLNGSAGGG